ncbi:MAG: hypothetical protein AMJ94_06905 [Deltaproteobacteria bacterium SM23_61]|nr:MAG: hypothetical protein AMJ94_06905 [Deltaproteobacteria bacterium SM23_61]
MHPLGPSRILSRLGGEHTGRWKIDRIYPIDWEKTQNEFLTGDITQSEKCFRKDRSRPEVIG